MTNQHDNAPEGHFDRRDNLMRLLEADLPTRVEPMRIETYKALTPDERAEFDQQRIDRITGRIIVQTPDLKELLLEVRRASLRMHLPIGRTGVVLSGLPTAGKTTTAFRAMVEALHRHAKRYPEWKQLGHIPVVYIEIPPRCTARSLMGRILEFLQVPFPERMTQEARTHLVTYHLMHGKTSLIVFDEMQNLQRDSHGHSESLQAIKGLMNSVKAVPLYVGIQLEKFLLAGDGLGEQFAARSSLVTLKKLSIKDPEDRKLWASVIYSFEKELGLLAHAPGSLPEEGTYLWNRTRGSLGATARLLTNAALDLIADGDPDQETISREHLDRIKLDMSSERELDRAQELQAKLKVGEKARG